MSSLASAAPSSVPTPPRLAAAVVLGRDRPVGGLEVFMVRRHVQSEFAPDVYVFPGGSVKAADREAEAIPGLCVPAGEGVTALGSGLRVAALRELFEEAGVLLAYRDEAPLPLEVEAPSRLLDDRAALCAGTATLASIATQEGLRLATDALLYWAHWITPPALPRRFDTHFFLATAPVEQVAIHDAMEVTDSAWVTPEAALAGHARGEFPLVFATIHQLRALVGLPGVAAAHEHFAGKIPETIMPEASPTADGGYLVKLPDDPNDPVRL
jgi:8-oxo-dGTP pyrophosphatase MutT (NUDIX family)